MPKTKNLFKTADTTIAVGSIKRFVPATINHNETWSRGDHVDIAKAVNTPAGIRFRVKGTTRWLSEADIKISGTITPISDYRFKSAIKKSKLKTKKKSTKASNNKLISHKQTGIQGMNKTELKTLISNLSAGEEITVTFLGDMSDNSGTFKVLGTRRGRGKGGSLLVDLEASDGSTITTGTPRNTDIMNITLSDGTLHGYTNEAEVPRVFDTDTSRAVALKEQFNTLLDADGSFTVDVESPEDVYNGTFTVTSAKKARGRYGQVILTLADSQGVERELWSYRHSGIVTRITVNR